MILKDIAESHGVGRIDHFARGEQQICTRPEFGIILLKSLFSEAMQTGQRRGSVEL